MVDRDVVKGKLIYMNEGLNRLLKKRQTSLKQLKSDKDLQDIILYNLQVCIQSCIDIAAHIISDESWPPAETLAGLFDVLSQKGVIGSALNDKMRAMVGLRNIIVHEYQKIDFDKVYMFLQAELEDFKLFAKKICKYSKI